MPEKVAKPEPPNWSLVSPSPRQMHLMRDFTMHMSHRFSVLGRQPRNQPSRTRVLGLRSHVSIEPSCGTPCRTLAVSLGRTWTRVSGVISFPLIFSKKKYLDESLWRPYRKSCVSGRQGRECGYRGQGRDEEELRAGMPGAFTLCKAPPCMHYMRHPHNSPSDSAQRRRGDQDSNPDSPPPESLLLTTHCGCPLMN